jgi:hypothetical protein
MSAFSIDSGARSATSVTTHWALDPGNVGQTLELSETRTYDAALETLGAYKLTGHFPTELEIVLRDLRVLDEITFEVEPKTMLSDTRHVQFCPTDKVQLDRFADIVRSVKHRIGADPARPWWIRLFQ